MLAQFLGAFAGAALVYGVYFEALREVEDELFEGERRVEATGGIFATYPQPFLSIGGGFIDQAPSIDKFSKIYGIFETTPPTFCMCVVHNLPLLSADIICRACLKLNVAAVAES